MLLAGVYTRRSTSDTEVCESCFQSVVGEESFLILGADGRYCWRQRHQKRMVPRTLLGLEEVRSIATGTFDFRDFSMDEFCFEGTMITVIHAESSLTPSAPSEPAPHKASLKGGLAGWEKVPGFEATHSMMLVDDWLELERNAVVRAAALEHGEMAVGSPAAEVHLALLDCQTNAWDCWELRSAALARWAHWLYGECLKERREWEAGQVSPELKERIQQMAPETQDIQNGVMVCLCGAMSENVKSSFTPRYQRSKTVPVLKTQSSIFDNVPSLGTPQIEQDETLQAHDKVAVMDSAKTSTGATPGEGMIAPATSDAKAGRAEDTGADLTSSNGGGVKATSSAEAASSAEQDHKIVDRVEDTSAALQDEARDSMLNAFHTSAAPQDEARDSMLNAFRLCDVDGSGLLSINELIDVLEHAGIVKNEAQRIFHNVDQNGDKGIDYIEFVTWVLNDGVEPAPHALASIGLGDLELPQAIKVVREHFSGAKRKMLDFQPKCYGDTHANLPRVISNLMQRFTHVKQGDVVQALEAANGHGGIATHILEKRFGAPKNKVAGSKATQQAATKVLQK